MDNIALLCKSFRDDVKRAVRLARSITTFNSEKLAFYMSVPAQDLPLFQKELAGIDVQLIGDEEIVKANPAIDLNEFVGMPGGLSQQVVKSEFWRLGVSENYVCLDSDCYFLRSFGANDFVARDGTPYTVMTESKELLYFADIAGLSKIKLDRIASAIARRSCRCSAGRGLCGISDPSRSCGAQRFGAIWMRIT
jgi:hypothetical protein